VPARPARPAIPAIPARPARPTRQTYMHPVSSAEAPAKVDTMYQFTSLHNFSAYLLFFTIMHFPVFSDSFRSFPNFSDFFRSFIASMSL